ncbi:hypothetical protein CHLNCDRAFT_143436 [Chlorella variabilis]|uniref:Proline-rich protein PRCC n=1 Tax=Chlorella variabilis TaxID=554065 RepID=E1ZAW8_CHLVA|nr:hypothetical protein CHLNCDRAFT_143436 [Chlorella variabilis]EFN56920.1 hypothetical protein CHLNCDRAFT_143436 [Chlorella variabilis]|eukprot:XP_005849022.1 hypothetical protein CHLNCDRAFT_143436 [Chlorella variabilis]
MDLLGGYGSGSDSDPGSPQPASNTGTATLLTSRLPVQAAPPVAQQPPTDPSQLASRLPAPSGAKAPLFSGLPKPAQKKKVVVQFRVPISYDPADVKAVEEEPARKRQKASARGRSLSELLPAPKNAAAGSGRRLDVLGGGAAGGAGAGAKAGRKYDSDDDEIVPGTEDRSGMVDLAPGDAPGAAADGNEAFRVDAGGGGGGTAAAAQYDAAQQQQYASWQAYYQQHGGHEYNQHQQAAVAAAAATAVDPAEAMLQAALAAEREKAARRGQPAAAAGIEIREVRGDQLKAMDPGQRAGVDAIRNALGADYEAKLRKEAGSDPSKLAKRRHQIGSLYHYAKQKELEQLEVRAAGSKTKAETQKKYGW